MCVCVCVCIHIFVEPHEIAKIFYRLRFIEITGLIGALKIHLVLIYLVVLIKSINM